MDHENGSLDDRVDDLLRLGLRNKWYCIAASAQVKDEPVALTRLGDRIVSWRDAAGDVHVVEDRCPHRGAPLSAGLVRDGRLTCRYHGIQIAGDGTVAHVPAIDDCPLVGRRLIKAYPVIEHYGGIFAYFGDAGHPDPIPFTLPEELTSDEFAGFVYSQTWGANHQYILDNLVDPMHGPYLHGQSFALAYGSKKDLVELTDTAIGFEVGRKEQHDQNFDWLEFGDTGGYWIRVEVFYPPAGGPGGKLRIMCFITPIDGHSSRIHFWRVRRVQGWQRDMWRFLFKTRLEHLAWEVMEQDREMLEALPDWPAAENLYQHDIGVTRLRRRLRREAEAQVRAVMGEPAAEPVA